MAENNEPREGCFSQLIKAFLFFLFACPVFMIDIDFYAQVACDAGWKAACSPRHYINWDVR